MGPRMRVVVRKQMAKLYAIKCWMSWGVLTTLVCASVGCGQRDELPWVHGVVTFDGSPVAQARVSFYPESGRASLGVTDKNGYYRL